MSTQKPDQREVMRQAFDALGWVIRDTGPEALIKVGRAIAALRQALAAPPESVAAVPAAWVKHQKPYMPKFHLGADRPYNDGDPDMGYQPLYDKSPAPAREPLEGFKDSQRLDYLEKYAVTAKPGQPIREAIDMAMSNPTPPSNTTKE